MPILIAPPGFAGAALDVWPALELPVTPPVAPMEAKLAHVLPRTGPWQFEPKWDGFRCVLFRDHDKVALQSQAGQSLTRYFPEIVEAARASRARRFVLDGEIVVPVGNTFSFDALLQRVDPVRAASADSRIRSLAEDAPAALLVFDLLVDAYGHDLTGLPLTERRAKLERFIAQCIDRHDAIRLSPATTDRRVVARWETSLRGRGVDGIIAKRLDLPYASGQRAMQKLKWMRTVDCVVGGFTYAPAERLVSSLLLGLYDESGRLNHVGFCATQQVLDRAALTRTLESMIAPPGFTGRAPVEEREVGRRYGNRRSGEAGRRYGTRRSGEAGRRYGTRRSGEAGRRYGNWEPVDPRLVVEVRHGDFSGGRFRHAAKLLRFRADKPPRACTIDQLGAAATATDIAAHAS